MPAPCTFSSRLSQPTFIHTRETLRQVSDLGRFPSHPAPLGADRGRAPVPKKPCDRSGRRRVSDVKPIPDEYAWMLEGSCRGADTRAFFPSNGLGVEAAQRICNDCEVRVQCLEYALLNRIEQGVWGGASERERRRILRGRRRENASYESLP